MQKSNVKSVPGTDPLQWVNKENSLVCTLCEANFNFTTRKHNCRVCGNVFCGNCTKNKLPILNGGIERACFICFSANTSLDSEEQRVVDEACTESNEFPQMRTLVFRKKVGKKNTRHHAIIVVTRYRILRLKRGSSRVLASHNLLDLSKLTMVKRNLMLLEFGKQTGNVFTEHYETSKALELALTIRIQHSKMCLGMPNHCQLAVFAPDESYLLPIPPLPQIGVAGGFCDAYRAWSNFYSTEPSEELIQYVIDSTERIPYVLDLTSCPGNEPGTNISFDLRPIFASLRYNNYFLCFSFCDVSAKGAMELLANCLRYNRTITQLKLSNLYTSYLTNVGHALAENKANVIQDFDFSGTQISEKAIKALGLSIIAKDYGIRELKFSNCGLTGKGIGVLMREGLLANIDVSYSIETLDISNNRLDEEGSILLQLWLSKIAVRSALMNLNISKSGALLNIIIPALESLSISNLDISNNPMDVETAQILSNLLINTKTLTKLNVSSCGLTANSVALLIASASSNSYLQNIKLILSSNNADEISNSLISSSIRSSFPALHTLDLSSTKLSEKALVNVVDCLSQFGVGLHTLVLNDLFNVISDDITGARLAHMIADMTLLLPNIKVLSIANHNSSFFSSSNSIENLLIPFLQRMHRNSSLLSLNLSNNRMGDKLAVYIAEMLRFNTTLVDLNFDDNRITISGFQSIEYSLHRNRTLQKIEYPLNDIKRCMSALSNHPMKEKKLFTILSNIQLAVYFNRQTNGAHELVAETNAFLQPRAGPILLFEGQPLPGEAPAIIPTPIPGVDYTSPDVWNNSNSAPNMSNDNSFQSSSYSSSYQSNNDWGNSYSNPTVDEWPVNNNNNVPQYPSSSSSQWSQQPSYDNTSQYNAYNQSYNNEPTYDPQTLNQQWPQSSSNSTDVNRTSDLYQALASVLGDM